MGSKVLDNINAQIKRNNSNYESVLVKVLYENLVKNGLTSSIMFHEMVKVKFIPYGTASYQRHIEYYIKPEFLEVVKALSKHL